MLDIIYALIYCGYWIFPVVVGMAAAAWVIITAEVFNVSYRIALWYSIKALITLISGKRIRFNYPQFENTKNPCR